MTTTPAQRLEFAKRFAKRFWNGFTATEQAAMRDIIEELQRMKDRADLGPDFRETWPEVRP